MKTLTTSEQSKISALAAELSSRNSEEKNVAILKELTRLCEDAAKNIPELSLPMKELLDGITKWYSLDLKEDVTQAEDIINLEKPEVAPDSLEPKGGSEMIMSAVPSKLTSSNHEGQTLEQAVKIDRIYYGTSANVPESVADVQALSAITFSKQVVVDTGTTNRILSIVIKDNHVITSAEDIDNPVCKAVNYSFRGKVTINGAIYKIYSFELGAPYSINYRHKFNIR
jgi:hypothetical protein